MAAERGAFTAVVAERQVSTVVGVDLGGLSSEIFSSVESSGEPASARLFESVALGPVEAIVNTNKSSGIVVLGQYFATDASGYSVGDYVLAASSDAFGTNSIVSVMAEPYTAGSSQVLLRAPVASLDATTATMTVGSVGVDYSAALSVSQTFEPEVGHLIEVTGTQPSSGGLILIGDQVPIDL